MKQLDGRVALVTGAGQGIGRGLALKLAGHGAKLVLNDLDEDAVEKVAQEVNELGSRAVVVAGSVTADDFADRFIQAAMDAFGDWHIIVNNAGYTWDKVIQKMSDEQFDAMYDVHVKAPFRILRAAAEPLQHRTKQEAEDGLRIVRKVVNISSVAGTSGNPGQANYSSAKAAIIGMTKTLSKEWGRYNVAVNCVAFGLVSTRLTEAVDEKKMINVEGKDIPVGIPKAGVAAFESMIPMGRAGTVEEAANAVYLFCSPDSDYVSGQILTAAGGLRI